MRGFRLVCSKENPVVSRGIDNQQTLCIVEMGKQKAVQNQVAALVLAAGSSVRLGRPKQLLRVMGTTLVRKMALAAMDAGVQHIFVVTGAYHNEVAGECTDLPCTVIFNGDHEQGIGTSIRSGLTFVTKELPALDAVLVLHVDQPMVDPGHIRSLLREYTPGDRLIVASAYAGTFGVPVVVDKYYFDLLLQLEGDRGAKPVLIQYADKIRTVPLEGGEVDIDTEDDLNSLEGSF
jgi:molybdenum cofactor cytidylyltransferase